MHFSVQMSLLVDVFIVKTRAELAEVDVVSCWCLGASEIPLQKKDGPFADVIACLDELSRCEPSTWA